MSSLTLAEISTKLGLQTWGLTDLPLVEATSLEQAGKTSISFVREHFATKLLKAINESPAGALVVNKNATNDLIPQLTSTSLGLLLCDSPYETFLDVVDLLYPEPEYVAEISEHALIDASAKVAASASIGPFTVIGPGVSIGERCVIGANVIIETQSSIGDGCQLHGGVVIRSRSIIGPRTTIHNNAVIGADGFGYIPDKKRGLRKVPQIGRAILGSDVEVGANSAIDRGAFGDTFIGDGCKIDNLVQIGHNCRFGKYVIVCGHVGIAGSCEIGDGVVIGGHAGIADHVKICPGVRIAAKAGVIGDIEEPGDYAGFPASRAGEWRRQRAGLRRLPELVKKMLMDNN